MSRSKIFIENILVYGLGSVIGKIIPFLLLPFITRLLPDTKYYGLYDILNVIVSFSSAIVVLGLYDMMFRMFFEKDTLDYKKKVCSSSLFPVIISGAILLSILITFRAFFSSIFFSSKELTILVVIGGFSMYLSSLNVIVSAPTRMQNKKVTYILVNVIGSVVSYSISIFMLVKGYFLLALPIGLLISSIFGLLVYSILNYRWFSFKLIDFKLMRHMLVLGLPLVPVFLFYWIFNSFDRLMISKMLGNEFVGIYAVGSKIASVSQLIYAAFAAGWQYFAFSTMKDKDQVFLTSRVFEYLGIISFSAFVVFLPFVKPIVELLFEGDYTKGFTVIPYLFLSPLILMLFQTGGNQFLVIKKTYYFGLILLFGALVNVALNYFLIPVWGIEGASIATLMGYLISTTIAVLVLLKLKLLTVSFKFIVCFTISMMFLIVSRFFNDLNIYFWLFTSFLIILLFATLYRTDLFFYYNKFKKKTNE